MNRSIFNNRRFNIKLVLGISIFLCLLDCGDLIITYGIVYAYLFSKMKGSKLYPKVKFRTIFFERSPHTGGVKKQKIHFIQEDL